MAFNAIQRSITCSTVSWVWHALHWGGFPLFNTCPCVMKVCLIRSQCMMIHHNVVDGVILLCLPSIQFRVACPKFQDFMMTAIEWERWERVFWSVGSSQSMLTGSISCRVTSQAKVTQESGPTHKKKKSFMPETKNSCTRHKISAIRWWDMSRLPMLRMQESESDKNKRWLLQQRWAISKANSIAQSSACWFWKDVRVVG